MILGIDLHNIRDGGGINYVSNLLRNFDMTRHPFSKIVIFGSPSVLAQMPTGNAIEGHAYPKFDRGYFHRVFFLLFRLTGVARQYKCDVLYSPGGLYFGRFRKSVTISRNMLPFQSQHWSLYGGWKDRVRLIFLRHLNGVTFRRARGLIFLNPFAAETISMQIGRLRGCVKIIPHGVDRSRFERSADWPLPSALNPGDKIRLICVARLEPYRHQIEVARAVASLRLEFPSIELHFYGPGNNRLYLAEVVRVLRFLDPQETFLHYHGSIANARLPKIYGLAHLHVFASSCENMPNTLIEALTYGIPTISSDAPPMPDIHGGACIEFESADVSSIATAIRRALNDWDASLSAIARGQQNVARYSWSRCADETFAFLGDIGRGDNLRVSLRDGLEPIDIHWARK